jgi:FtsH-binding integral membrane protein
MTEREIAERRRKATEHLNSKKVLNEVYLWITLTLIGIAGICLSLIFGPRIDDALTKLSWEYQLAFTLIFLTIISLYIRHKTK